MNDETWDESIARYNASLFTITKQLDHVEKMMEYLIVTEKKNR